MICITCNKIKAESEFYKSNGRTCKECVKERSRKNWETKVLNPTWKDAERKRHREKYHRLGYLEKHRPSPEKKKEIMDRYKKKYPEKIDAHLAIFKKGIKSPEGISYHHWSYKKEHHFDWIELQEKDHYQLHRFIQYDPERMMYRTLEGVLLDSKEKHIQYFESIKHLD